MVVPVPEPVNVTQGAFVEVVQLQAGCVVIVIEPVDPPGGMITREGETEKVHVLLGSVMMKVLPATVSVAVRAAPVVFAAAVNPISPNPVRPVPFVTVTQDESLLALHAQPVAVVTETLPLPPAAASAWPVADRL